MTKTIKLAVIGSIFTSVLAQAAPTKSTMELHESYRQQHKSYVETTVLPHLGSITAVNAKTIADSKILGATKISANRSDILTALVKSSGTTDQQIIDRTNSIIDSVAAKKLVEGKNDTAAKAISDMADARLQLIASLTTLGNGDAIAIAKLSNGAIKSEHVQLAQEAINKLIQIKVLRMGESEMADYRTLELLIAKNTDQGMGLEAATVKAIMEMKKVSYEKAIDYLNKMKGCKDA